MRYQRRNMRKALDYNQILMLEEKDPVKFARLKTRIEKSMERMDIIARAFCIRPTDLSQVIKDKKWKRSRRRFGRGSCD